MVGSASGQQQEQLCGKQQRLRKQSQFLNEITKSQFGSLIHLLESLILAQDERWRRA